MSPKAYRLMEGPRDLKSTLTTAAYCRLRLAARLCAPLCGCSHGTERKYRLFRGVIAILRAAGRGFRPSFAGSRIPLGVPLNCVVALGFSQSLATKRRPFYVFKGLAGCSQNAL